MLIHWNGKISKINIHFYLIFTKEKYPITPLIFRGYLNLSHFYLSCALYRTHYQWIALNIKCSDLFRRWTSIYVARMKRFLTRQMPKTSKKHSLHSTSSFSHQGSQSQGCQLDCIGCFVFAYLPLTSDRLCEWQTRGKKCFRTKQRIKWCSTKNTESRIKWKIADDFLSCVRQ